MENRNIVDISLNDAVSDLQKVFANLINQIENCVKKQNNNKNYLQINDYRKYYSDDNISIYKNNKSMRNENYSLSLISKDVDNMKSNIQSPIESERSNILSPSNVEFSNTNNNNYSSLNDGLNHDEKSDNIIDRKPKEILNEEEKTQKYHRDSVRFSIEQKFTEGTINNALKDRIEAQLQFNLENSIKLESDAQPGICLNTDHNFNIFHVNKKFTQVLFYLSSEIISTNFASFLTFDSKNKFKVLQNIMSEEEPLDFHSIDISIQDKMNKTLEMKLDIKKSQNIQFKDKPFQFIQLQFNDEYNWWLIEPLSPYYLIWTASILAFITFLLFWIPQEISFHQEDRSGQIMNSIIDNISLILFSIDIVISFLVIYEVDGLKVRDTCKIAMNQIQSWFIIDLVSTIPFELFFRYISINTNILKSLKIIKLIRLVRMIKIDTNNFVNQDELSKNEQGKEIISLYRRNRGFIGLLKNNFQIVFVAHQFTILYQQYKSGEDGSWLMDQFNQQRTKFVASDVYFFLMQENIKTSLGLGVATIQNKNEIIMQIFYMFLGLSLFGQGIGNISAQLNVANQLEIEYQDSVSYQSDLCSLNEIDARTQKLIMNDIEKQFEKQDVKEFQIRSKILSKNVIFQLETSLQRDFVKSFRLFESLNIHTIRLLKSSCQINTEKIIQREETIINSIFLVTKGFIRMQDSEMNLINEQAKHQIMGMEQFKELVTHKQQMDLENIYKNYLELSINKSSKSVTKKFNSLNTNSQQKLRNQLISSKTPKQMTDEFASVSFPQMALGCDEDLEQIVIQQDILEDILLQDPETFLAFYSQCHNDLDLITDKDTEAFIKNLHNFQSSKHCCMTVLANGQIWDYNSCFSDWLNKNQQENIRLHGSNIQDIIDFKSNDDKIVDNLRDCLSKGNYHFRIRGADQGLSVSQREYNIKIVDYFKNMIIREDNNKIKQYKYRKSMLESYIIEFNVL